MDDVLEFIFTFIDPISLIGCVGAGLVFKTWSTALGVAVFWTLIVAWIQMLLLPDRSVAGQAWSLAFFFAMVQIRVPVALFVTAFVCVVAYAVRRLRAR